MADPARTVTCPTCGAEIELDLGSTGPIFVDRRSDPTVIRTADKVVHSCWATTED